MSYTLWFEGANFLLHVFEKLDCPMSVVPIAGQNTAICCYNMGDDNKYIASYATIVSQLFAQ